MKVVLAQLNFVVGDVAGNLVKVLQACQEAVEKEQADLVVFPELTLSGYPPEDVLFRPALYDKIHSALVALQAEAPVPLILGYPEMDASGRIYNRVALIANGGIQQFYDKQCLPNYAVFDEKRYFTPGNAPCVFSFQGIKIALLICEDLWLEEPVKQAKAAGAELVISINASPYHLHQLENRHQILTQRFQEQGIPIVYLNLIGGQDELVFDGNSMVVDGSKGCVLVGRHCEEQLIPITWENQSLVAEELRPLGKEAEIYQTLVLGLRDYLDKNRFKGAVIGLSGGIDSALTLAIACDALGSENVDAVMMPFAYTSNMSMEDAKAEASALGVNYHVVPIESIYNATTSALELVTGETEKDVTEQNIQARSRGMLLMAIANKQGKLVITTGNKSELAVGYATLYGDMVGGFAAIKDLPKKWVYELANYRNSIAPVIPPRVIERAPSAELAPDQVDEDNLPPYDVLDKILEMYIEQDLSILDIVGYGFEEATVRRVAWLVDSSEYKRRQAPPGVRISSRAFGKDRRYPITSAYHRQF